MSVDGLVLCCSHLLLLLVLLLALSLLQIVLRRADKQHIPMEIPEARDLAELEIIETEVELERERARKEEREEAEAILAAEEVKKQELLEKEAQAKRRKRVYSAVLIQGVIRYAGITFLGRNDIFSWIYLSLLVLKQKIFRVQEAEVFGLQTVPQAF